MQRITKEQLERRVDLIAKSSGLGLRLEWFGQKVQLINTKVHKTISSHAQSKKEMAKFLDGFSVGIYLYGDMLVESRYGRIK